MISYSEVRFHKLSCSFPITNWLVAPHLSLLMTKPTEWHLCPAKTQISLGIHPVWSESSLSAWRKLRSLATHWVHREDSDQTGQMPRLIRLGRAHLSFCLFCHLAAYLCCFHVSHLQFFWFNCHLFRLLEHLFSWWSSVFFFWQRRYPTSLFKIYQSHYYHGFA